MKRMVALLLAMTLAFSCMPATALEMKYHSYLLDADVILPDTLEVIAEYPATSGDGYILFFSMPETGTQITSTLQYVPEFIGMQTKDLPKSEIDGWKEFFIEQYPNRAKSMMIKPQYGSSSKFYRFYGQNERGSWMLSYSAVRDGLYVCTSCETGQFGFKRNEMQMIFEAFNASLELFAKNRGVSFVRFSPEDYEVEIFNLLYDDSPNSYFNTF